ncbi:MAG: 50S ribosomal protein L16 [bacterium]
MALIPTRVKYRKQQRGRMKGVAIDGNYVAFGEYGLQALEPAWITSAQLEAVRIVLNRTMKRGGKVWIRVVADKPVTSKPAETRMGSGKGAPDHWVAVVKPGKVLFEIGGLPKEIAEEALRLASFKLPIKTQMISRNRLSGGEKL